MSLLELPDLRYVRLSDFTPRKTRTGFERLKSKFGLWREWRTTTDELTLRIKAVSHEPLQFSAGTRYESHRDIGASLEYPSAEVAEAIFQQKEHGLVYARGSSVLGRKLIRTLLLLDPKAVDGRVTGFGMGAVSASLAGLKTGDHVVASKFLFSSCTLVIKELERYGIRLTFIDGRNPDEWRKAIEPGKTKRFWFETPGNPTMEVVDIAAVSRIAHEETGPDGKKNDILVVVDNSLATLAHRPLSNGADFALFSSTKTLGWGQDLGGFLMASAEGIERLQRITGNAIIDTDLNPIFGNINLHGKNQAARVSRAMLKNTRYLSLRFNRQQEAAGKLADHIHDKFPHIRVLHPTLGVDPQAQMARRQMSGSFVISLVLRSKQEAFDIINGLIEHGFPTVNNFGSNKTETAHPASTTHASLTPEERAAQGLPNGLVRVSVGIENVGYLIRIFDRVLSEAARRTIQTPAARLATPPHPAHV